MSNDFTRQSDPTLEAKLKSARSFEDMRSLLKADATARGILIETQGGYEVNMTPAVAQRQQTPEPIPVNPAQDKCVRVIYPAGNNRFEIYGESEQDLDEKERRIRAMFSGAAQQK